MIYKDYKEYIKQQRVRAESKWGRKWDYDEIFKQELNLSIDDIDEFIDPKSVICMGCRSGTEVFEFKERFPEAEVYGVDISTYIKTIRSHLDVKISLQDFNNLPEEWENKFDLVFSNSLDHAYRPEETIQEWHRVAKGGGHLFLELSKAQETNIEHHFRKSDLKALFPKEQFRQVVYWTSPIRNIFTVLYEVIK